MRKQCRNVQPGMPEELWDAVGGVSSQARACAALDDSVEAAGKEGIGQHFDRTLRLKSVEAQVLMPRPAPL